MTERIGLMICGHGSRDEQAVAEFANLAQKVREKVGAEWPVEHGYLEFARPIIREGLDALRAKGCTRILAVPGMLFAAGHAKNDIPSVLNRYAVEHGIRIDYARELGLDPAMLQAAADRIREAIAAAGDHVHVHDTLLMVVGRGSSDPDANSNVTKLTRMLQEGFGFGWAETAYSGVTFPLVGAALEHAVRLGFRRIVVFPYFLFTGILVQRIYDAADEAARRFPEVEIVKAPYLNDHPKVVETFISRARGILEGDTAMNCGLCKYRTQILGFEHQVGEPQMSHHHHVEGIGTGHAHTHGHDHHHHGGPAHHHHEDLSTNKSNHGLTSLDESHTRPNGDGLASSKNDRLTSGHPAGNRDGKEGGVEGNGHDHGHAHHHHAHDHHDHHAHHHHHHAPYPHADHPLGPRSLRREE